MNQNEEYEVFPLVGIPIEMEDEPLHTDEHPQCDDPTCPCQREQEVAS